MKFLVKILSLGLTEDILCWRRLLPSVVEEQGIGVWKIGKYVFLVLFPLSEMMVSSEVKGFAASSIVSPVRVYCWKKSWIIYTGVLCVWVNRVSLLWKDHCWVTGREWVMGRTVTVNHNINSISDAGKVTGEKGTEIRKEYKRGQLSRQRNSIERFRYVCRNKESIIVTGRRGWRSVRLRPQ